MVFRSVFGVTFSVAFLLFTSAGCSKNSASEESPSGAASIVAESTYCSTISAVTGGVLITSRAQFKPKLVTGSGLGADSTAVDVKYAEVAVVNSAGATIQCGETDATGNISLSIPQAADTYTLKVFSRAFNSRYKVSVLNNPTANLPYSISASFTLVGSETALAVTLTAADASTSQVLSGAFNILEQIYKANEYLRSNTACATANGISCTAVTVPDKIQIFWTAGLSPGAYYNSASSPISFFSPTASGQIVRGLYILGGVNGDLNCTDSDQFDNSVILHEYGHFLEDFYGKSNSPGGSHNGNFIVDPRLAWSEGWANFFQAAVRGASDYTDTYGNTSCSTGSHGISIQLQIQTPTAGQDYMALGTAAGEGIFREVSVSRTLYHTMNTAAPYSGPGVGFPMIWRTFADATVGFHSSSVHFRNIARFNELMRAQIDTYYATAKTVAYDNVLGDPAHSTYCSTNVCENQLSTTAEYALPVSWLSGACSRTRTAVTKISNPFGGTVTNLLKSNDFFSYYFDGTAGNASITLTVSSGAVMNLYIYKEEHVLVEDGTSGQVGSKESTLSGSISLSGQAAGYYLIQVQAPTAGARTFSLSNGSGLNLCSSSGVL